MQKRKPSRLIVSALCLALATLSVVSTPVLAQEVPTPASVLGSTPGDDYYLASYADSVRYFHELAKSSDRIRIVTAGRTTQGRQFEYAIISNPENLDRFEHYVDVSKRLADSRGLTEQEAKELARDSRIIVHIDGGMHSSEVADHQLPPILAHKLLSSPDDPEVQAILEDVILVLWPTLNPDGMDMQVDWYRRQVADWDTSGPIPTGPRDQPMPWLYQEYVGHDNNRDGYMLNMIESQVVIREEQKYAPAIWYTHHQVAPFPARIWMPPFYDPTSANIHPLMRIWTTNIGINMISRFEQEGKTGAIAGAPFDNWYPGFLDYIQVFRHSMAFFTEVAHASATPRDYSIDEFPENRRDLKPQVFYPSPWRGGIWRIGDSVDYMLTASMSTLETAVKYRETLLFNRYLAGSGTIARFGSEGPYAYVLPAEQADPQTAALLAQKMIDHGVEVHRTKSGLTLDGRPYPVGSWVIRMDQPYAGLVQELFERQKYPDAFLNDDGTPLKLPYDATGWTLPLQMGVDAQVVTAPLPADLDTRLERVLEAKTQGALIGGGPLYALSRTSNASFVAVNEILAAGGKVGLSTASVDTAQGEQVNAFVVSDLPGDRLETIVQRHGLVATAVPSSVVTAPIVMARVGVYRPWGSDHASMDAGWTEWLLKQNAFNPVALHNADVAAGNLSGKFDILVLPDLAAGRGVTTSVERLVDGSLKPGSVPDEYAGGIGQPGVEALKAFVADGGTLIAINRASTALIELLDLPVENALAGLSTQEFYCAGALFSISLDGSTPVTVGLQQTPTVMFNNGPAFIPGSGFEGRVLARYPQGNALLSGFAVNPERLQGLAAALEVEYGDGRILLYGFAPQWRAQPHGTFKFIFSPLYVPAH